MSTKLKTKPEQVFFNNEPAGNPPAGSIWTYYKSDGNLYKKGSNGNEILQGIPIGSIQSWHKSFTNTPALTSDWVQCDGQVLNDGDSPYDGQTIPDLNGESRFLRGSAVSGTNQAEDFKSHTHSITRDLDGSVGSGVEFAANQGISNFQPAITEAQGGAETRPINMSVVWIIKIK